jgi:hypothetical protein
MRRLLVLAGLLLPSTLILAHGCGDDTGGSDPEIENFCGWLGDPENCYRTFAEDVGITCGAFGRGTAPRGTFKTREELATCILSVQNGAEYEGGQVLFEPPLDLAALPPELQTFKFIKNDGTTCGEARFVSAFDFGITITGEVIPDSGAVDPALIEGGAYNQEVVIESERMNVSCPGGSTYFFERLQVTKCRQYEAIVPRAEMDINPGSIGVPGVVRFRVFYPPIEGALEDAQPYEVEYFECIIPPPPDPCEDGEQNGNETDVDCGGPDCPVGCGDEQKCASDQDCRDGLTCRLVEGLKKCKE